MRWWRTLRAFLPAAAWAAIIWLIGGMQSVPGGDVPPGWDKVAHFGMYGVLGFLCGLGWSRTGGRLAGMVLIVLALLLGAGDEWRQTRIAVRTGDVADWIADAAGVIAGFLIAVLLARQRHRTDERK